MGCRKCHKLQVDGCLKRGSRANVLILFSGRRTPMITNQYAAGFFDGEGSVYANSRTRGRPPTILVCISNTNKEVLQALKEQWGGSLNGKARREGHSAVYQWTMARRNAYRFMKDIQPYLIIKREVVAAGLAYCEEMMRPQPERIRYENKWVERDQRLRSRPVVIPEFRARIDKIHAEIRRLNVRGAPYNATRNVTKAPLSRN
jgi:hypothetical protein